MAKTTGVSTKERGEKKERAKALAHTLNGMKLLGEVVCFNARAEDQHKHKDVVDALNAAGLDSSIARELMPRFAFSRACRKLEDEAVIDVVKRGNEYIKFQFTKMNLKNEEWEYVKDTTLKLMTDTGKIECPKPDLQKKAQDLLDESMEVRTTSDVTRIVQRLFEKNADLFPLRDQGGVYFVPQEHCLFTNKIAKFLEKIGGSVTRFPVPAGTTLGDKAVQESIADTFQHMIQDHMTAIDDFTVVTRTDTLEGAANRISATRVKIEAYAHYLSGKSKELLSAITDAKQKLDARVKGLATERANAPQGPTTIFGHAVSGVLKWMGLNNWDFADAKKVVVEIYGFVIAESTIRGQLWCGTQPDNKYGKPAEITQEQADALDFARKTGKMVNPKTPKGEKKGKKK